MFPGTTSGRGGNPDDDEGRNSMTLEPTHLVGSRRDESAPLVRSRDYRYGDGRSAPEGSTYRSFEFGAIDNKSYAMDDDEIETDISERLTPPHSDGLRERRKPERQRASEGSDAEEEEEGARAHPVDTPSQEALAEVDNAGDRPFKGKEILDHLRQAHIYGNLDWVKHLKNLKDDSEEVHETLLNSLKEQPIDIRQKLDLLKYLRRRPDSRSKSNDPAKNKGARKRRHQSIRPSDLTLFPQATGLWNGHIKRISAYFGSHVANYFVFVRFLVLLDLVVALLLLGLVTLPQVIPNDVTFPKGLEGDFGVVSSSIAFYAAYSDTWWGNYDRPLAFFLTWAGSNVLCFLVIVTSMYLKYNRSKREGTSGDDFPFSTRLFSSWDHTLTDKNGAEVRKKAISVHTKEMVKEEKENAKEQQGIEMCKLWVIRVLVNIVVLAVLGGSGYAIYLVAVSEGRIPNIPDFLNDILSTYRLSLAVAGLKMVVPLLFDQIIKLEKWHPRTEVKFAIARTAVFYLASLVVFILSIYNVSTKCVPETNSTTVAVSVSNYSVCCWEHEVGHQVVKVVLIDLAQIVLTFLLFDYIWTALVRCTASSATKGKETQPQEQPSKQQQHQHQPKQQQQQQQQQQQPKQQKQQPRGREFNVSSEVLDVIYGQSLVWLGLFFSPLLAALGFVKLVFLFFFSYVTARACRRPPDQLFRASRSGNFFLFMLLLNFFVCLFTMVYAVIQLEPSRHCGPFTHQDHVIEVLTSRVGALPTWLRDAMVYVSTPSIVVPLILFLLLGVLYFKAKSASYNKVIKKLRDQLQFERRVEKRKVFARGKNLQGPGQPQPDEQTRPPAATNAPNVNQPYPHPYPQPYYPAGYQPFYQPQPYYQPFHQPQTLPPMASPNVIVSPTGATVMSFN